MQKRYDLGPLGIVYRHCDQIALNQSMYDPPKLWVVKYKNGVERRCTLDMDGRVLHTRWMNLGGSNVSS